VTAKSPRPLPGPAALLARGGVLPAGAAGLAVAAASAALASAAPSAAGLSALIGGALATGAMAAGPALLAVTRTRTPPVVMAVALTGFAAVLGLLGMAFVALGELSWLRGDRVGYGIVAAVIASAAGQVRAAACLRIFTFGAVLQENPRPLRPGQDGSPAGRDPRAH
jgi:hypothetical protein